jgi:hypothetical protein
MSDLVDAADVGLLTLAINDNEAEVWTYKATSFSVEHLSCECVVLIDCIRRAIVPSY